MQSFDLIVIGSGSGLEVSSEAADRGLSVAVVEHGPLLLPYGWADGTFGAAAEGCWQRP